VHAGVGAPVGAGVGLNEGAGVGVKVGLAVGAKVGLDVGANDGLGVGVKEGAGVGVRVGLGVGLAVGLAVGAAVGTSTHSVLPFRPIVHLVASQAWHMWYACWSWYLPDGQWKQSVLVEVHAVYLPVEHGLHTSPLLRW
jgi:hypothetical protein